MAQELSEKLEIAAKVQKAHEEGKLLKWEWNDKHRSEWFNGAMHSIIEAIQMGLEIRLAPTWQLPSPPPGKKWHRDDWTEEMLPPGYRPVLKDEIYQKHVDEIYEDCRFVPLNHGGNPTDTPRGNCFIRTRRHLLSYIPWTLQTCPVGKEIIYKQSGSRHLILCASRKALFYAPVINGTVTYEEVLRDFTLPDGSPCGTPC